MPFLRSKKSSEREAPDVVHSEEVVESPSSSFATTISPVHSAGGMDGSSSDDNHNFMSPEIMKKGSKRGGLYATISNSFRRVSGNRQQPSAETSSSPTEVSATAEEGEQLTEEDNYNYNEEPVAPPRRRIKKKKAIMLDPSDQDDDDPVMAVFEARAQATQRVRFSAEIDDAGGEQQQQHSEAVMPAEQEDNKPPSKDLQSVFGIQKFVKNALFGKATDETEAGVQKEIDDATKEVVWASATSPSSNQDFVRTKSGRVAVSFTEDPETRAKVMKLLNKARRAQCVHFRYEYAVKCHVKAMEYLKRANYPDDHQLVIKVADSLVHSHHILSSLRNSANIVKMGLKYEDTGDLVRALKMYTIAFRIRRDNLSRSHPSLVVLLNMLGSIQIKRGELEEAMQIYQLALKDEITYENESTSSTTDYVRPGPINLLARAVSYRELGTIYERKGDAKKAIKMYEKSLECLADFKLEQMQKADANIPSPSSLTLSPTDSRDNNCTPRAISPTAVDLDAEVDDDPDASINPPVPRMTSATGDDDGMEVLIQELSQHNKEPSPSPSSKGSLDSSRPECFAIPTVKSYASFFPPQLDIVIQNRKRHRRSKNQKPSRYEKQADHANIDVALTLHQIAQLHRSQGDFHKALSAFEVALRGMKYCLGKNHPNVAAILGNIGNLQKEMGDLDSAFDTYQQVLGIESYRLGLSHPDVAITLHNIATIDAARGKHDHALALYGQVINLQRKLFGTDHVSVAVTAACMADVYDKTGDMQSAVEWYEEAARIKTIVMGRHSLEVARLLHKLGKLAIARLEYHLADSLVSRAILIYRLNKLPDEDEWMIDACRDAADSEAAIAMGQGVTFEC